MDMYVKDIGLNAVDCIGTRIKRRALVNMARSIWFGFYTLQRISGLAEEPQASQ